MRNKLQSEIRIFIYKIYKLKKEYVRPLKEYVNKPLI